MNIHRTAKFRIGIHPVIDPCNNCLIEMVCDRDKNICIDKIKYDNNNPNKNIKETVKMKKVKNNNIWSNINGIRRNPRK